MRKANIWQWEGRMGRAAYAAVGVAAFAAKFFIDWVVVTRIFHRPWSLLNYWRPFGEISGVHALTLENRLFAGVMLFIAAPFIWLGLAMTVKRLRDAGEPTWVAALFFAPVANLLFFLVLILKPSAKEAGREEGAPWPGPRFLDSWVPETRTGSALLSIAVTAMTGLGFTLLGTQVVATYGWGLFVGLPFCLGLFAVLMHSYRQPRSYGECLLMAVLPVFLLGRDFAAGGGGGCDLYLNGGSHRTADGVARRKPGICDPGGALGTPKCPGDFVHGGVADAGILWPRAVHASASRGVRSEKRN